MDRQRLERLAALLEAHREGKAPHFDLRGWGEFRMRAGGFLWLEQLSCNTAACAIGLACASGAFADDGISYQLDGDGRLNPVYGEHEGWDAVKAFFQLDHEESVRLFAEHSYTVTTGQAAARAVAARIRETIEQTYRENLGSIPQAKGLHDMHRATAAQTSGELDKEVSHAPVTLK